MTDYNIYKVPIFPNINDAPRMPTANLAGNGSDIIQRFNGLIDGLNANIPASSLNTDGFEFDLVLWVNRNTGNDNQNEAAFPFGTFKTLDKALAVAVSVKNSGRVLRKILLSPGIYSLNSLPGFLPLNNSDAIYIESETGNPNDVTIQSYFPITLSSPGIYCLKNLRIRGAHFNGICIFLDRARIQIDNVIFGQANNSDATRHIEAHNHSTVEVLSNYNVEGSVTKNHVFLDSFSFMDISYASPNEGRAIDVTNFTGSGEAFISLQRSSYLSCWNTSFSGINEQITGKKFLLTGNSIIDTAGKDLNFFPGNQQGQRLQNSQYF